MQSKKLHEDDGQRTFALIFETGDELLAGLEDFAKRERLTAAQFSAIGAFSDVVLAYFDWDTRKYQRKPFREQVEVASLTGDVAEAPDGSPAIHVHAVLGRRDLSALAGHLVEAHVRPTLELILTEQPTHLRKRHDPESGLALIRIRRQRSAEIYVQWRSAALLPGFCTLSSDSSPESSATSIAPCRCRPPSAVARRNLPRARRFVCSCRSQAVP